MHNWPTSLNFVLLPGVRLMQDMHWECLLQNKLHDSRLVQRRRCRCYPMHPWHTKMTITAAFLTSVSSSCNML